MSGDVPSELVEHTWAKRGRLGIKIMPRGAPPDTPGAHELPCGVVVSEVPDDPLFANFPTSIKPGMLLVARDGEDLRTQSFTEIMQQLRISKRPVTLSFESTPEHEALGKMVAAFLEADKDCSGALDNEELAQVIQKMYHAGTPRHRSLAGTGCLSDDHSCRDHSPNCCSRGVAEGTARRLNLVEAEVNEAMATYDTDNSGVLEFAE